MELDPVKLKRARQSRAMTQAELAKAAGIRQGTVSLLEQDDRTSPARMSTVRKLADALGIDPSEIISEKE